MGSSKPSCSGAVSESFQGSSQYCIFRHDILDVLGDTLRYIAFRWLTFCWNFKELNMLMVDVLLILWDTEYFSTIHTTWTAYTRYLRVNTVQYRVFRGSILAILHAESEKVTITTYNVHTLMSTYRCRLPLFGIAFFLSVFSFLLINIFPSLNWVLLFQFLSSATLMQVTDGMASRY